MHAHDGPVLTALLAVGAGTLAGALVRATPGAERACRLWWVASAIAAAGAAAVAASEAPVPAGSALAGAGLAAASVVDGVEGRVPTPIAFGTAAAAGGSLVAHAVLAGAVGDAVRAAALAAVLVAGCAALWLVGALGFGDVRLAAGTATAMLGGPAALALLAWGALFGGGLVAVGRRLGRRRRAGRDDPARVGTDGVAAGRAGPVTAEGSGPPRGEPVRHPVPFAPPLALAWLVTVLTTGP